MKRFSGHNQIKIYYLHEYKMSKQKVINNSREIKFIFDNVP